MQSPPLAPRPGTHAQCDSMCGVQGSYSYHTTVNPAYNSKMDGWRGGIDCHDVSFSPRIVQESRVDARLKDFMDDSEWIHERRVTPALILAGCRMQDSNIVRAETSQYRIE